MKVKLVLEESYDSVAGVRFDEIRQGLTQALLNEEMVAVAFERGTFVFKPSGGVNHLEIGRQVIELEGTCFLGSLTKEEA